MAEGRHPVVHFLPGDVVSFRTAPISEFGARETGRYAALKILAAAADRACFVVLDGVFDHPPELSEVAALSHLRRTRFNSQGRPATLWANFEEIDLIEARHLGSVALTPDEQDIPGACRSFGPWSCASSDAEGEWRWRNDRAAFEAEVNAARQATETKLRSEKERRARRLKTLTWAQLLEERLLARWDAHPPYPPAEFTSAARDRLREAALALQALGPKPRKAEVRALLKATVNWFNAQDAEFGGVIETEEREDICAALEDLVAAANHQSLIEEIDEWRNW
jgi:hypothetical protein